ncbi:cellulose-binding domain-containing protein [Lentzea sp. NPDC051838]|uniref:cellulose-binding domain-containing protein n=1 Tax=Lentzea sp. NPDC051838 TaxID=3154849 RepID=UPI00342D047B
MRPPLRALRTRPVRSLVVVAVLVTSAGAACGGDEKQASSPAPSEPPSVPTIIEPPLKDALRVTVQRVDDVRTVRLSDGEEVKIKGLAAPDDCWAAAATAFAKTMLLDKPVESTGTGSLRLADGTDYALLAVELGMVRGDAGDDRLLVEAEKTASDKRLGRWGPPCVQPTTAAPVTPRPTTTTPPAPQPVTGCSVQYRVTNMWPGGFRTDVTLRNTGTTDVTGWTLKWAFANGETVTEMWNATSNQSGKDVSATAMPYNQAIPKGESTLLGFTAASGRTGYPPRSFSLNGFACTLA